MLPNDHLNETVGTQVATSSEKCFHAGVESIADCGANSGTFKTLTSVQASLAPSEVASIALSATLVQKAALSSK